MNIFLSFRLFIYPYNLPLQFLSFTAVLPPEPVWCNKSSVDYDLGAPASNVLYKFVQGAWANLFQPHIPHVVVMKKK